MRWRAIFFLSLFLTSKVAALLLHYEERAPRNQEGRLHGARGCWRVDCGFAEVLTVGGNLSAGVAAGKRRTGRAQRADALATLKALSYPARSMRAAYLTCLGPAPSRESFQEFCSVDRAMHRTQLSNPALQFAFRSNAFVTYRSSTVTQCRDRAKPEKRNVRLLCPLPKARKSVSVLTRESVPPRNSPLGRSLSTASSRTSGMSP
jgi:hypothetical protein